MAGLAAPERQTGGAAGQPADLGLVDSACRVVDNTVVDSVHSTRHAEERAEDDRHEMIEHSILCEAMGVLERSDQRSMCMGIEMATG